VTTFLRGHWLTRTTHTDRLTTSAPYGTMTPLTPNQLAHQADPSLNRENQNKAHLSPEPSGRAAFTFPKGAH
jgi:hypothetical protein